jgi:hypothetical protein
MICNLPPANGKLNTDFMQPPFYSFTLYKYLSESYIFLEDLLSWTISEPWNKWRYCCSHHCSSSSAMRLLQLYGINEHEVSVVFNSSTSISNFVKICKLFQKLKWGTRRQTQRQPGDIASLFPYKRILMLSPRKSRTVGLVSNKCYSRDLSSSAASVLRQS